MENHPRSISFLFFNDTATTEIYTLSLHDALPISNPPSSPVSVSMRSDPGRWEERQREPQHAREERPQWQGEGDGDEDRKSTRLNSSHANISYAVFCLKKKNYFVESAQILNFFPYV